LARSDAQRCCQGRHAWCVLLCASATATAEICTLSLHDALPILSSARGHRGRNGHPVGTSRRLGGVPLIGDSSRSRSPTSIVEFKDRKSTRLNSSHVSISYAVFCLKKKKTTRTMNAQWRTRTDVS